MTRHPTRTANSIPSIEDLRAAILAVTRKHGAYNIRVFGSFVRNEQTKKSDVDLLVELPERSTLIDQARLMGDLERTLKRKVDVLTYNGINRHLRERILSEAKPL
jgi:predicted nucleotidyltransferase